MKPAKGTLIISPQYGNLTRDTETFGRMDPYIKFNIGSVQYKTKPANDMGKKPVWKESLNCNISDETMINFALWDKDVGADDFIAEGSYNIIQLFNQPGKIVTENIPVHYKKKSAGTVTIRFQWQPVGGGNYPNLPPQGQPIPPYQPNQYLQQQQQGYPQQQQQYPPQQYNQQQPYPQQQPPYPQQQGYPQQQPPYNPQYPQQQPPYNPQQPYPQQQPPYNPQYPNQQFNQPPGYQQQPIQPNYQQQQQQQMFQGKYPMVRFDPNCKKCHGSGLNQKKKNNKPCGKCYEKAGFCKKCLGTKVDLKKGKPCKKCH